MAVPELNDTNQELREKLEFLEEVFNNLKVTVTVMDIQKVSVIWSNNAIYDILGYSKEEISKMSGKEFWKLYHEEDQEIFQQRISHFKDNPDISHPSVYRMYHKKGHILWMYSTASAFRKDVKGNVTHILGFSIDFTEKIKAEQQLEELLKENLRLKNQIITQKLTKRELEVISLITRGFTDKKIAIQLYISIYTAETHRKKILSKLKMSNTAALVNFAVENGLN